MHCPSVRSWTESIILDVWTSIFWFLLTSTVVHFFFNFFKDFHGITFTVFFFFQSLSLSLNFNKIQSFIVSDFTYEKCFEGAGSVIPPETLSIPVPQLQAVFLFPVFVLEVVWFACIPVFISHWFSSRHPEELALLSLVSPAGPEVFVSHTLQGQEILLRAMAAIPTWVIRRGIWTGDGGSDGRVS